MSTYYLAGNKDINLYKNKKHYIFYSIKSSSCSCNMLVILVSTDDINDAMSNDIFHF